MNIERFKQLLEGNKLSLTKTIELCEIIYDNNGCSCGENVEDPMCFSCSLGNLLTSININLTIDLITLLDEFDKK